MPASVPEPYVFEYVRVVRPGVLSRLARGGACGTGEVPRAVRGRRLRARVQCPLPLHLVLFIHVLVVLLIITVIIRHYNLLFKKEIDLNPRSDCFCRGLDFGLCSTALY